MNDFEVLRQIIQNRRTTKPASMNGKQIDDRTIEDLLELANWAPTHARTEPWRFIVFDASTKDAYCASHAELYKQHTVPEKFMQGTYEKLQQQAAKASHIIIVYCKTGLNPKIPAVEEIAATSSAIQNLLLGAAAKGIAAIWSTGGMIHHPSMKDFLQLAEEDVIMGAMIMGYTDELKKPGSRITTALQKTQWNNR